LQHCIDALISKIEEQRNCQPISFVMLVYLLEVENIVSKIQKSNFKWDFLVLSCSSYFLVAFSYDRDLTEHGA
jgi:hypothetical protein